ncbi:lysozyme [Streptomyces cavernicola]|uniref:Lysozyme n=1 Tax=Streptomyces cavernicola TaxID=3043613 RepID=A0ABT6S9H2_9ACTN|nr:lysozyme [Streptomyces sp. B-S-A6]MDI3404559.1 lysozyme [Streptomyces sp. B-S-A6]
MPVHRPGSPTRPHRSTGSHGSRRPAVAVVLTVLSLLLAFPGAAQAAEDVPPRGSAHMGMGVVEHDGEGPMPPDSPSAAAVQTEGVDVSSHQGNVNWASLWSSGVKWAYVKATEGTYYKNTYFTQQYNGSYNVGMIRGSYHFATPDTSSGAAQADYFVNNGGGWSKDGKTLPGALDIEWNPYGNQCFGKSQAGMVSWIWDFVNRYKYRTGRYPVIYTATSWWKTCTGNYSGFATNHPLWVARYNTTPGELPAGWSFYTMWQYTSSGPIVGDHNKFNGAYDRLQALANG